MKFVATAAAAMLVSAIFASSVFSQSLKKYHRLDHVSGKEVRAKILRVSSDREFVESQRKIEDGTKKFKLDLQRNSSSEQLGRK